MSLFKKSGSATRIPNLKNGKARQYLLVLTFAVAVYLGFYLLFAASDGKKKAPPIAKDEISTTQIAAAGAQLDPRESWIGGAGAQVARQESRLARQEQNAQAMADKLARLEEELRRRSFAGPAASRPASDSLLRPEAAPPAAAPVAPPAAVAAPTGFPPGSPGVTAAQIAGAAGFPVMGAGAPALTPAPPPPPQRGIGRVRIAPASPEPGKGEAPAKGADGGAVAATERSAGKTFLPIGLVRAVMLGGLDAPTGGQAQNEPLPVMLKLTDLGVLPNHFRANIKDCFAVGAAYGDIAAERAYIRLVTLSCVRKDGQALEVKVAGHVFDETGKLGVRGRLVSKQGQILANALLAGVVSGIGRGIEYSSSTSTVTAFGNTVSQPQAGGEFKAGVGQGVGRALDRLANYYISLAEKVFPVIEVDAQRHVDLAFTQGVELDIPLPELAYGDFDDE